MKLESSIVGCLVKEGMEGVNSKNAAINETSQISRPAAMTRRNLLEDAARKGYIVAPDHLPFPGLGHIRKDGRAYTWVPVDYVNDAVESSGKF
jgi:hypothetical protein